MKKAAQQGNTTPFENTSTILPEAKTNATPPATNTNARLPGASRSAGLPTISEGPAITSTNLTVNKTSTYCRVYEGLK